MQPFDEEDWRSRCAAWSAAALPGTGQIFELYSSRYSVKVEAGLAELALVHHARALEIANEEGGYSTPEERAAVAEGCCSHGLPPECCPVGCGDLEWD